MRLHLPKLSSTQKQLLFISILSVLLSFSFKIATVYGYSFQFWYDQARDATLSRQIILNHDLKIQGPSASGTRDTLYHGVWYYYLIAPWYVIADGNPMVPTLFLAGLTSVSIGLFVLLAYDLSSSLEVSAVAGVLSATSLEFAELGVYLANPTIAIPGLLLFYLSLWKVFYQRKTTFFWVGLLAFALGLCTQAAIWLVYLWGPTILGFAWYLYPSRGIFQKSIRTVWKQVLLGGAVYNWKDVLIIKSEAPIQ